MLRRPADKPGRRFIDKNYIAVFIQAHNSGAEHLHDKLELLFKKINLVEHPVYAGIGRDNAVKIFPENRFVQQLD